MFKNATVMPLKKKSTVWQTLQDKQPDFLNNTMRVVGEGVQKTEREPRN